MVKFVDFILNEKNEMTFVEAAVKVLTINSNKPMSSTEIWSEIESMGLIKKYGKTPVSSLQYQLQKASIGGKYNYQYKNPIFKINNTNPQTFELINSKNEENLNEEKNCYVVRAGRGNEDISLFINGNFVGIGYNTNNFDVSKHTKDEVKLFLLNNYEFDAKSVPQYLSQIELFKSIKEGDIVLSPDKNSIHVGVVASDIYLTNDRYPNRIDVEWFDEIEKNPVVNQPKTVFKIKGFDFENLDFKSDTVVEDDGVELDKKMTFAEAAQVILKQNDNQPMSAREIWEEIEERDLVETSGATPWTTLNAKLLSLSDNSNVSHKQKRKLFHLVAENPAMFILIEPEQEIQPDDELDLDLPTKQSAFSLPDDEVLPFSHFRASQAQEERELKPSIMGLKRVKNPFGCKQEDGTETSTLCILGKSGSGKTTTTESALESMGHEYLLYIPIDGEYTFSQYTGSGFEMSSIGEFIMMAQNNPLKFYTVIFDECHRSITINKLNTDLLQSLSSKRNRGGERFFTMDMTTKRMYTTPIENFPVALVEKNGKVLVPDNFGIICLSSQPALICRNEDFVNRVDLVVFHKSDRGVDDLTILEKIDRNKFKTKDELLNYINAELLNE